MNTGRENPPTRRPGARPRLFISYRRRFDHSSARLLKGKLTEAFGEGAVFRDVDDIPPGADFPERIREAVETCDAFLTLISPGWLGVIGELRDPDDFVRREIAAALARRVPLIPVLLGGAQMPGPEELPEEIRGLASRQAVELSDTRWDYDVQRLVEAIRSHFTESKDFTADGIPDGAHGLLGTWWGKTAFIILPALILLAVALPKLISPVPFPWTPPTPTPFRGQVENDFPTPTPPSTSLSYEQCLSLFRALGAREARVEASAPQATIVGVDKYTAAEAASRAGGFPLLLRLTDSGRDLGAVSLVYAKGNYPKGGVAFIVLAAFAPPCDEKKDYFNHDSGAESEVYNWDKLTLPLGGRNYRLRLGDHNDSLAAQLTSEPVK